jgi:hypothetical protein
MKGISRIAVVLSALLVVSALVFMSGCSSSGGYIGHSMLTEVQLSQANYTVLNSVTGTASVSYFLGMGPSDQDLLGQAKRDMIEKAQLSGGPKAIINVTTDMKFTSFLFWFQKTAYVSGEVIEFKK